MRKRRTHGGLTVNAIAGTNMVYFGLDLAEAKRKGCLGFAIQREDHTEDEKVWMRGMKTFEVTLPEPDPGVLVSSREHPFQSFQWADYSAKPGYEYTYTTIPLYGTPSKLKEGEPVSLKVQTEQELGATNSVYFNRGAVASQEYARRFQNRRPDEVGDRAYTWLSRGLLEGLLAFIAQAKGPGYGLRGAVYEFQWPDVLEALKAASEAGADVCIVYDAIPGGKGPLDKNIEAIQAAGIDDLCVQRTRGKLMHNKFFVLTRNDRPVAVWTGSTNLTENGLFGHSNCGHVVEDREVAKTFLTYWEQLKGDPQDARAWIDAKNVAPPDPWDRDTTVVFSPRTKIPALEWYARIAGSARKGLFMTFAFGMHSLFQQVYEQNDGVLRFALMEQEGAGSNLAQGKEDISRIRRLPNVVVAVGNNIKLNNFDRWLQERDKINPHVHVKWIHTKYMLVDPLGRKPIVISGSANFSKASTDTNDENMLVIRNDQRIADIYLGEFMRLHSHYAFREAVGFSRDRNDKWQPKYLEPKDTWQRDYFKENHPRFLRRQYVAGR
jgi:hypothetical protein